MSKLDERRAELGQALALVQAHTPSASPLRSCSSRMLTEVIAAAGPNAAAVAVVYAELADLAVFLEVARVGVPISAEVHELVHAFHDDVIAMVVASELRLAATTV